jgi:hypothetical protein
VAIARDTESEFSHFIQYFHSRSSLMKQLATVPFSEQA